MVGYCEMVIYSALAKLSKCLELYAFLLRLNALTTFFFKKSKKVQKGGLLFSTTGIKVVSVQ